MHIQGTGNLPKISVIQDKRKYQMEISKISLAKVHH